MTDQRERIHGHLEAHPGVHFNALGRTLELAPGQVQHHLRRLRDDGRIESVSLYGRTHYFTPEYGDWERATIALLRRETARDVIWYLLERGPSRPDDVTEELELARSTLEWHLDHLVEQGVAEKRRDERGRVTLALRRPAETAELLGEVAPSRAGRLVDRFERLVDGLLEE